MNKVSFIIIFLLMGLTTASMSSYSIFELLGHFLPILIFFICGLLCLINLKNITKPSLIILLLAFLLILFTLGRSLSAGFAIKDNLASAVHIYNVLLMLTLAPALSFSKKQLSYICMLALFGLIFLASYYRVFSFVRIPMFFAPNNLAQNYFYLFIYVMLFGTLWRWNKKFIWILWALVFYIIYQIECRSVLLGLLVIAYGLLSEKISFAPTKYSIFMNGLILGNLLFVFLYLFLFSNFFVLDLSTLFNEPGKGLFSGRQLIWQMLITAFYEHPFVGTGRENILFGSPHNSMLYILILFGINMFILFVGFLNHIFKKISSGTLNNLLGNRAFFAFLGALLVGFFEPNVITPPYSFATFLLFIFINSGKQFFSKGTKK